MEALRRLRFIWALACLAFNTAVIATTHTNPLAAIAVTLLMILPPYLQLRWFVAAALVTAGLGGALLVLTGDGGLLIATPIVATLVLTVGWVFDALRRP